MIPQFLVKFFLYGGLLGAMGLFLYAAAMIAGLWYQLLGKNETDWATQAYWDACLLTEWKDK